MWEEPKADSTLFDYSKPKKEKDLSELHSGIKWLKAPVRKIIRKALVRKKVARKALAKRKIIRKAPARKKVAPIMPKK